MNFDKLLEYQKIDDALVKIERKLASSTEKKKAAALNEKMKTAGLDMAKMNADADELIASAEKASSSIAKYEAQISEISESITNAEDLTEIEYYEKLLAGLAEDVQKLERELLKLGNRMDYVKDGSENLTRQAVALNEQYKAAVQEFHDLKVALQNEGRPIMESLKALEKDIDEQMLATYKRLRNNKGLPAIVEYKGDGSCFCGMNLPASSIGKLKSEGDWVECPNCGRIVVINK